MTAPLDRRALVSRHDVVVDGLDARSPLSVGNGELATTVDLTGLHTFADAYPAPGRYGEPVGTLLGTMAQWAWHTVPRVPVPELSVAERPYDTPRGTVPYVDLSGATSTTSADVGTEDETWLRANPHRLQLGHVVLDPACVGRAALAVTDVSDVRQRLDLWSGSLTSHSRLAGQALSVLTVAHPDRDTIGWRIGGPDRPTVRLRFPYGSQAWGNAADWDAPERHQTSVIMVDRGRHLISRRLDGDTHLIMVDAPGATVTTAGRHEIVITGRGSRLDLCLTFLEAGAGYRAPAPVTVDTVRTAAASWWAGYWSRGGAVDLSGSDDHRAGELERRIVLSSYQTMINCAGSLPPQETGLMVNSWRGRSHLEMHWWHAAHFPVWGRPELLTRSLGWYASILPAARATAARQGLTGARWPKQVGPDGRESPSDIGPFLVWQQPHPIHLAELVRRAGAADEPLDELAELVAETAEAMASFATGADGAVHLGPPLVPAQECYGDLRAEAIDPTFELAYWWWALSVAQHWRTRQGLAPEPRWQHVLDRLPRPTVLDGRYAALATPPYLRRRDHPSMLAALGVVPSTPLVDPATMAATLDDVVADWDWPSTWGWDYPVLAMTATRLGRPEQAVDLLLRDEAKNTYLANGHNVQNDALPVYLPGNGGLLTAVALMAAGWDGSAAHPGFGQGWNVRVEGVHPLP